MINRSVLSLGLFVLLSSSVVTGCGGDGKKAKSPESNAGITETSANTKEDMPAPPSKDGDPNAASSGGDKDKDKATGAAASSGGAVGGMIKVAAMKVAPIKKGKTDKDIELKADGTLNIDGKPAAKFKGDQVDSTGGTSMVTIGVDGSLVGNGVKNGLKFEGDDLVNSDTGTKLSVADDGTINATTKDGKTEAVAKAEGGGSAKRAALIILALYLSAEPAAAPPPVKKGPAAKPAAKPGGKKQKAAK